MKIQLCLVTLIIIFLSLLSVPYCAERSKDQLKTEKSYLDLQYKLNKSQQQNLFYEEREIIKKYKKVEEELKALEANTTGINPVKKPKK